MTKQWLNFKWLCIFDIAIMIGFLFFLFYRFYKGLDHSSNDAIIGMTFVAIWCLISFATDIIGIKLVNKLHAYEKLNKLFHISMLIFYILLCLFVIPLIYLNFYFLKNIARNYSAKSVSLYLNKEMIISTSILIFSVITSLLKIIFTWKLAKAVKKNSANFDSSFETI